MKPVRQIALLAALLAVCFVGVFLYENRAADGEDRITVRRGGAATLIVKPLEFSVYRRELRTVGTGSALQSVMLYPASDGRIEEVLFEGGQEVEADRVLLRLDDADEQVLLESARIEKKQLERTLARYDQLRASGAVSDVAYTETQDRLQLAQLKMRQAEIALEERLVRAPFSGSIGITDLHRGDRVTTNTEIATLDDRSGIFVDFRVPEEFANLIQVGDPVTVTGWSLDDTPIEGKIGILGSRIDPATRTLAARARIANPQRRLRPGASYAVQLEITGGEYPSVPEVAVLWSRDGSYVWTVRDDMPERIFVEIVRREKGRALIDGALERGDLVVVEGVQSVRPGRKVDTRLAPEDNNGQQTESKGTS